VEIENPIQAGPGAEGRGEPGEEVTDDGIVGAQGVIEAGGVNKDVIAALVAEAVLLDFRGFF